MAKKKKEISIIVTGDVIIDHHIYQGQRNNPYSANKLGSRHQSKHGGAGLVFNILQEVAKVKNTHKDDEFDFLIEFGLTKKVFPRLSKNRHSYAVWKPCKPYEDQKTDVWRMDTLMGYGHSYPDTFQYHIFNNKNISESPDILVIDDGGLGFRSYTQKRAWPVINNSEQTKNLKWIVLKMSNPIGQGDLWLKLANEFKEKLVVIISIDDVRKEEVKVSKGISWERSAQDLVTELLFNPNISRLLKCRHLIINFGTEGALHIGQNSNNSKKYQFIYDPGHMEREWGKNIDGYGLGFMSCFTTGIVNSLANHLEASFDDINGGIIGGLAAMRTMQIQGHGSVTEKIPKYPYKAIARTICNPSSSYFTIDIPVQKDRNDKSHKGWSIMTTQLSDKKQPLYGMGKMVALLGPRKVLANVPYAQFGALYTADRDEIEKLRSIHKLITDYKEYNKGKKPLSIAVFGPPGAGKSFGITQIARGILGNNVPVLTFNLSQFSDPSDLTGAFHQIRDKVLQGEIPVVFWDEFDSEKYRWLQYLLAPMQDGKFQEGQLIHPIGKCIFIFAGATSFTMENFGPENDKNGKYDDFKLKKGPDFTSRLHGYLNVLGPNRRQIYNQEDDKWENDLTDICFPIRRALLLRNIVKVKEDELLKIDRGVLSAIIETEEYKFGARSMERVISHLIQPGEIEIRRSNIPSPEIMELHTEYEKFIDISKRDQEFKTYADVLAPFIHDFYRKKGTKEGWIKENKPMDKDYEDLSDDIIEDNRQAAIRIPQVLELVNLYLVHNEEDQENEEEKIKKIVKSKLELLAEAEHDGWMKHKLQNGWKHGISRDNENKIHPCLVLYKFLPENEKQKDRDAVQAYAVIVRKAGYRISTRPE